MNKLFACSLIFAGTAASAPAQEYVETAADVDRKDIRARHEALRRAPPVEKAARSRPVIQDETRIFSEQRIEEVIDGAVLVSRPIDPGVEVQLVLMGIVRAPSRAEIGHHMVFEGRYYQLLLIAPQGPDELRLERARGQTMRVETVQRSDRRTLLLGMRSP